MPRKKRAASPFELMDDDYDEDASSQSSRNDNPPVQRNAANARERARMRVLSSAFGRLKTKLPNIPSDTKLSKLDTLRLATMYIKQLKAVVEGNAPLNTNSAMGEAEINGGPPSLLGDTPNCFLQLHSGAANMNWPFGLHHQVNHHSSASTNRSQTSNTYVTNGVTNGTPTWCQTETNPAKKTRFDTENYQQQQQPINPHNHEQQQENPPYLLTLVSSSTPPTPPNSQPADNTIWYSETPSPDLSSSTTTTSSSNGIGGYDGPSHHHPHQTLPHHHSNILLEHHLAHMQLTPPHSNASRSYPQHHHQHHASLAHQHQHYSQQQQHHQQYSHHLPPLSGDGRQHELQYINSNNLTAASIL